MYQYFAYGSNMDKEDLDAWCEKKNYPKITPKSIIPAKLVSEQGDGSLFDDPLLQLAR